MQQQSKFLNNYLFTKLLIISLFSGSASAEVLGLAGFNGSGDSQYAYIGAIIPINSTLEGDGFRLRLWGNYQNYDYDGNIGGTPTSFDVDGFGGSLSIGYRWKFDSVNISAYAGVVYKDLDVSPDDPSSDTEDDDVGAKFQLEINPQFSDNIDASLIGSYTAVFDSYWVRLRPGYTFANGLKFGPEIIAYGDDQFDKQNYGAFLDGIKLGNVKFGLHGGYEEDEEEGSGGYGGISLSTIF